jgi:hypothetical protein
LNERRYNDKLKTWQPEPMIEYLDKCTICGRLMLVRAIVGTTWLACCSEKCYEEWEKHESKRIEKEKQ